MDKAYQGFLKSRLIWTGDAFGMTQFELPISSVDISKLPLVPTDRRLGHQAEFVFLQLLMSSIEFEVLAHSIQLIGNKRTLGELDYIVRNVQTKEVLHIELTYKFYIVDKAIPEPIDQIIGPNRKDNFVYKLNKTRDKQLPLLYSEPSKITLEEMGLDIASIIQKVAFYAHIFVPYDDRIFHVEKLNEDCLTGFWVTREQMEVEVFKICVYYRPSKSEWLHIPHDEVQWKSYHEIMDEICSSLDEERSVMLWKSNGRRHDSEIERFFVC